MKIEPTGQVKDGLAEFQNVTVQHKQPGSMDMTVTFVKKPYPIVYTETRKLLVLPGRPVSLSADSHVPQFVAGNVAPDNGLMTGFLLVLKVYFCDFRRHSV